MHIESLNIENFGPHKDFRSSFTPTGINVISGKNGWGKTQIIGALLQSLSGPDIRIVNQSRDDGETGSIEVVINDGVRYGRSVLELGQTNLRSLQRDPILGELMRSLAGPHSPNLFIDAGTRAFNNIRSDYFPESMFAEADIFGDYRLWNRIRDFIDKRDRESMSFGHMMMAVLARELHVRSASARPVPLIADGLLFHLDDQARKLALHALEALAEECQVIVFGIDPGIYRSANHIPLYRPNPQYHSLWSVDYRTMNSDLYDRLTVSAAHHQLTDNNTTHNHEDESLLKKFHKVLRIELEHNDARLDEVLEVVRDTNRRVKTIEQTLSNLLQRVDTAKRHKLDEFEVAHDEGDDFKLDQICSEVARSVSRFSRESLVKQKEFVSCKQELNAELGNLWTALNQVSQSDLVTARLLIKTEQQQMHHLAILQICRVIEGEIIHQLFHPFRKVIDDGLLNNKSSLSKSEERTFRDFAKFCAGKGNLTLGSFGWIAKYTLKNTGNPLFLGFRSYLEKNYPLKSISILETMKEISLPGSKPKFGLVQSVPELRNLCAHPPELQGDAERILDRSTYLSIWALAFDAPVRLLELLSRP